MWNKCQKTSGCPSGRDPEAERGRTGWKGSRTGGKLAKIKTSSVNNNFSSGPKDQRCKTCWYIECERKFITL